MLGQRRQDLGWRKRNMQEKSDPAGAPSPPQGVRDGNQVIVMDPDEIVVLNNFFELCRKMIIDPKISTEIPQRKLGEVQPIMQNRPQHTISEAIVIFLVVVLRQIGDNIFNILVPNGARP